MSAVSCIIFDFFDVVHTDHQKRWMQKYGLTQSEDIADASRLFDTGAISYRELLGRLARASGSTSEDVEQELAELSAPDYDVIDLIRTLRASGYRMGLLSNTATEVIQPLLAQHALEPLFDQVVVSGEVGIKKPDPRIFELTLSLLDRQPAEALFIDDNPENVRAAQGLGMHGIHHTGSIKALRKNLTRAGVTVTKRR